MATKTLTKDGMVFELESQVINLGANKVSDKITFNLYRLTTKHGISERVALFEGCGEETAFNRLENMFGSRHVARLLMDSFNEYAEETAPVRRPARQTAYRGLPLNRAEAIANSQ